MLGWIFAVAVAGLSDPFGSAAMSGAEHPDFSADDNATTIIEKVAAMHIKGHTPIPMWAKDSESAKATLVVVIDAPNDTQLLGGVDQELTLIAGQPFADCNSIKTLHLDGWTPEESDLVASSILTQDSARFFHGLCANSNKLSLKGADQHAAQEYFTNNVAHELVRVWLDMCLSKISADVADLKIKMHVNLVSNVQELAQGWHCDPISNKTRFVVVRELGARKQLVDTFKGWVFDARGEVGNNVCYKRLCFGFE